MKADGAAFNSLAFVLWGADNRSWLVTVSADGRLPDDSPELPYLNNDRIGPLIFLGKPVAQQAGRATVLYFPVEPSASTASNRQRLDAGNELPGDSKVVVWSRKEQNFVNLNARIDSGVVTLPDVKEPAECIGAPIFSKTRISGVITGRREISAHGFTRPSIFQRRNRTSTCSSRAAAIPCPSSPSIRTTPALRSAPLLTAPA
jgi:hypothetical protein